MKLFYFCSLILLCTVGKFASASSGCLPPEAKAVEVGFDVSFYTYPYKDNTRMVDMEYMAGGFKSEESYTGGVLGVTDINFSYPKSKAYPTVGDLYVDLYNGYSTNIQNFIMQLEGYFYADVAGDYTFNLNAIDDSLMLKFGADEAFTCCVTGDQDTSSSYTLFAAWNSKAGAGTTTQTHTLAVGYYPIVLNYCNKQIPASLDFSITKPDGTIITDFTNILQFENLPTSCPATVSTTLEWNGASTATTTLPAGEGTTVTVEILTPAHATTITTEWTGSYTKTYTLTATDGGIDTAVVDVPSSVLRLSISGSSSSSSESTEVSSTAVASSSATVSETYGSTFSSSTFSSLGFWSNSSAVSSNNPSSTFGLSSSYFTVSPSVVSVMSLPTSKSDYSVTETDVSTTVVTVTSCNDGKCSVTPVTTGVTVVTITTDEVLTEYSTYCPLSSKTTSADEGSDEISVTRGEISSAEITVAAVSDSVTTDAESADSSSSTAVESNSSTSSYVGEVSQISSALKTVSTAQASPEAFTTLTTPSYSNDYSDTLALTGSASSSLYSSTTMVTISEGKAEASHNIQALALFVTYFAHMLL